ncbi:MAG: hypothetical protein CMC13_01685 [Flavobacteriaceae bacterium]|nr:hypothetical protein [Flavobacteriaceae bacterium]|tara:strand:- start:10631 stop:12022 length:1392 start_codon:yes stop_codon:yes gene_type:complete
MRLTLFFSVALCSLISVNAQFGAPQIISSETDKAYMSIPVDIDNDGFIDVLSAQAENHTMVWFRNLDGEGNFSSKNIITSDPALYLSIDFADVDSDGDDDIVFLVNNPREIRWIENLDGQGNYGNEHLIVSIDYIQSFSMIDFDNDSDLDVIATLTNTFTGRLSWFENTDGLGTFSSEQVLLTDDAEYLNPILEDLDNDGDIDILTSLESHAPSKIVWYENSGNLSFNIEHEILTFQFLVSDFTSVVDLQFVDIDNDGMKDVFFETYHDDAGSTTGWLKNMGGTGEFAEAQNITFYNGQRRFYDLDNDGDNDMLGIYRQTDLLFWVENTNASGSFDIIRTISDEVDFPRDTQAADFDGDGLLDVVVASLGDNTVVWFKNTGILDVVENVAFSINMYPNPTSSIVYLNTNEPLASIVMHNVLGTKIKSFPATSQFDISEVPSGLYFFKIKTVSGMVSTQKIIKR